MALPIRYAPVLEGAAARRFERMARQAEKERGTIKFTEEQKVSFEKLYAQMMKVLTEEYSK